MAAGRVTEEIYGKLPNGEKVKIFTLTNKNGLVAKVMEYGANLVSMQVPDGSGKMANLTLGYDTLEGARGSNAYFGATVGRFGNRIKGGQFTLEGETYQLAVNNGNNHLHGGTKGFDKRKWDGNIIGGSSVEFTYFSENNEEGYPGNLHAKVTYTLNDADELIWHAEATADAATPVNMVLHTYWNLSGDAAIPITDHLLTLVAEAYLPTDSELIPTGAITPVAGTPLDFRAPRIIGERIDASFPALKQAGGYDHAFILDPGQGTRLAARLQDPKTGRLMEILTNQPAVQFYSGNFLSGVPFARRSGLCLETEAFPDAPNQPHFPSSILRPGSQYSHTIIHRFSNPTHPK